MSPAAESSSTQPAIAVTAVRRSFGRGATAVPALGPIDLTIAKGEFAVIVGASGCGKSTLLRLIAGFDTASEGTVLLAGEAPVPGRHSGIVFQQPRLLPWRTVGGNIDLALSYAGVPQRDWPATRDALLERVGLVGLATRHTWELSGGQQQRVAIARALAVPAPVLLLDEPFAALDALTREVLQEDLRAVSAESGRTAVLVTHSVDEAVFLGSRIVVLSARPGQIVLDLPVDLPRTGVEPAEIRASSEFARIRGELAVELRRSAATPGAA